MSRRVLIVRGPTYFSALDEKMQFDWLASIPCVSDVGGKSSDMHITLKRLPGEMDLRELIAIFHRYRMDMTPLATLKSSRNRKWFFENKNAYWHAEVFGKPKRKRSTLKPKRRARPSA
jgi:hypothetical protein